MFYIFSIPIIVMSIILHEIAHGWAAYKCGDPTAKMAGRLTLNPIPHIDLKGTIIIPGILIALNIIGIRVPVLGMAKPVPINPSNFRNWNKGIAITGAAGPLTNIILAVLLSLVFKFFYLTEGGFGNAGLFSLVLMQAIAFSCFINIILAVFNLIPIPPLDGSRIVMAFLRPEQIRKYLSIERYGIMIVLIFLYMGGFVILLPIINVFLKIILGFSLPQLFLLLHQ